MNIFKRILNKLFCLLLFFLLCSQTNAMAQASIVDTKAPYLLVKISVPNEKTLCFLWDVNKNQYADIKNNASNPAIFPCDLDEISNWLSNSLNVTRNLYFPTLCEDISIIGSWEFGACDLYCATGPGNCDNTYAGEINCWDELGNSPLNNFGKYHIECSGPYIKNVGWSHGQMVIENTYPAFNGGLSDNYPNTYPKTYTWSFGNKIQGKSAYRIQYHIKSTADFWYGEETDGRVIEQYNYEDQGEFKIFTPLGILAKWNYNLLNRSYYFIPGGNSCPSEETIESFSDSKQNMKGIYCDNAMAQIFTIESLGIKKHRPCAWAHGGYLSSDCFWNGCSLDPSEYVKFSEFKVLGSATHTVDAEYTDAKTLQRNSTFESAVVDLKTKLESSVTPPPSGKLTNYSLQMEFRKIPCSIDTIVVYKKPLLPGKPAKTTAFDGDSKAVSPVIWTLKPKSGNAFAIIDKDTGAINDISGEGTVTIRAENPENPDCSKEIEVEVGCEKCSADNQCEVPGTGEPDLHSIELKLNLGKGRENRSSGAIYLKAKTPNSMNSTTGILELLRFGNEVKAVYENDALRQVVAPETFVNIVALNEYSSRVPSFRSDNFSFFH